MPAFNTAPVPPPALLTPGVPFYVLGSQLPGPTCRMMITNNSVTSNVVTLTVLIVEGNTPAVGDLVYVYGTANSAGALSKLRALPSRPVRPLRPQAWERSLTPKQFPIKVPRLT